MTFAEKLKDLRQQNRLSQDALAKLINVPLRTYRTWEVEGRFPKKHEIYSKLAEALNCDVAYLMTDEAEFITNASANFGSRGAMQAQTLLDQTKALFAGGEISEDDQLAFINELKEIYIDAKLKAAKFTPKKYLSDSEQ